MDGGDIDAVTGATISSRAVTEAVGAGIVVYRRHAEEIAATGR
jgi:Na+-translocating ferredoxin:NAD+ oxidoreductase RnfG subunit